MLMQLQSSLKNPTDIYELYERLDWNRHVKRTPDQLLDIMDGSYYVVYVYENDLLIGTGRMISDGHLSTLICGVGVDPNYQNKGIGKIIMNHLKEYGVSRGLFVELTCVDGLEEYYNKLGFKKYGIAMK
jgi:GNAT superfamily N-acetyltransferase